MKLYQVQSSCNYSDCWVNVMKGRRELTVDISSCVSRTAELTQPITSVPSRPRNCIISICLLPCLPFHYKFPLTKCKLNLNECLTPLKATISLRSDFTYLLPFSIQINSSGVSLDRTKWKVIQWKKVETNIRCLARPPPFPRLTYATYC